MSSGRLQEVKNNENYNAVTSKNGCSRLRESVLFKRGGCLREVPSAE